MIRPIESRALGVDGGCSRRAAWCVVLVAYLGFFGALVIGTKGLPYSIDNNESFSSLWHARHMYELGLSETKGLADEVMAWHSAASPYVHTHQGNFPRLFAFAIYLVGARSIESQIILTTFTVGLAAIWFAFRFLCRIGPPLFAASGCLVMITDYALFGQWQVDTYRVWYGFFFFGSLFWVSALERYRRWPMLVTGIVLFSAVFYGEYVFAAFVGITACCYAAFSYPRSPRTLLRVVLAVGAGGAAAAGILLTQLVAYMGWQNVKLDIGYTLAARNMARDPAFADMVDKFYRDHRIIFWNNYFDITDFRSLRTFLTSFFEKHLQYYSPWICLCAMVVLVGALTGLCRRDSQQPSSSGRSPWPTILGTRVAPALLVAGIAALALRYIRPLFNDSSGTLWHAALGMTPPGWLGWVAFAGSTAIALALAVFGTVRLIGRDSGLVRLLALSLCVVLAYAVVYRVFTGYIFSGYLNRQAPFLVFWTDVVLGGALYVVVELTRRGFANVAVRPASLTLPIASAALLLLFLGAWATLQVSYLIVVPPTGESFLQLVSKPPFRGGTFVANDYPAPVSDKSHGWAYADSSIFSGQVKLESAGFTVEHDTHYLWFADRASNKDYMKPQFGVLIDQPASISEALKDYTTRMSRPPRAIAFDTLGIIERTQEPLQPFLRHQLLATDGHSYSIVKFDWDFPPFLRPVDSEMRTAARSMTFDQKLAFSETGQEQRRRWSIEIEPTEPVASGTHAGRSVELIEASVDGRPVFSREALVAAGWVPAPGLKDARGTAWIGSPGGTGKVAAVSVGDAVTLRLLEGPDWGSANVSVNDMTQVIDLQRPAVGEHVITLNTGEARDRFTSIPALAPGTFVSTWLGAGAGGPVAVVGYRYAHQDGATEEGTTLRIYNEGKPGHWRLADTVAFLGSGGIPVRLDEFRRLNPDTLREYARLIAKGETRTYLQWLTEHLEAYPTERKRPGILRVENLAPVVAQGVGNAPSEFRSVPLPRDVGGRIQLSVTPGTRTKAGPEYFGLSFNATRLDAITPDGIDPVRFDTPLNHGYRETPYGYIKLRLRFPTSPLSAAEPIVAAGVEEAGDFIYVIYSDSTHVRIGFDHWFKGGPLSPPIPVDYAKEHDLEFSMGSLFPPEEDIIFVGMDPGMIADLKGKVWVKLDGRTVLEAKSEFWDSPPTQVTVGRNDIRGTTSSTRFSGEILSSRRIWPDAK